MRNLIWGMACVLACAAVAGSAVNGANELVYTVGAGETETVSAAWSTDYAGIVKEGEGTLVVAVANKSFAKPVKVNAGVLETTVDGAFGADVVTVASGAALSFKLTGCGQNTSYNTALKNVRIAGAGPDGLGAITFNGGGSADRLLPLVTLTADATVGGRQRWGTAKFDLAGRTLTLDCPGTYMMFNGTSFLNPGHVVANNVTFQGSVNMAGGTANTYTVSPRGSESSYLSFWGSSRAQNWSLKVEADTVMRAGGNYNYSRDYNKWTGPVQIAAGKTLTIGSYDSTANCVQIQNAITGGGALRKDTGNYLFLDAPADTPNSYSGGTLVTGGMVCFNRPGALALYDQPGKLVTTGEPNLSFYCPLDRWTAATVKTAVDNATLTATTRVLFNIPSGVTVTQTEDFNKPVYVGTHSNAGVYRWAVPSARSHGLHLQGGNFVMDGSSEFATSYAYVQSGTLTVQGGSTLDLSGANGASGASLNVGSSGGEARLVVSNGVVKSFLTTSGYTASINVGSWGGKRAVMEVYDGALVSNKINVASGDGQMGAVYQRGGYVRNYARGENDAWCGSGKKSYGYYGMEAGVQEIGGWFGFGHNTSAGVLQMSGGEIKSAEFPIGRGGYGRMYMTGGSVKATATIHIGEQQWGNGENLGNASITVDGPDALLQSTSSIQICQRTNNYQSVLNLNNGGVACAPVIYEPDYSKATRAASAKSFLNFNGGTYRAYTNRGDCFGGWGYELDRITVYEKGATIDTQGFELTDYNGPLLAPSGKGVVSVAYTGARTGYLGSPEVYVEGGGGAGATVYIPFDSQTGTIGDPVVTSHGNDYASAPVVWFYNAARTAAITCTVEIAENVSGGLVKTGSGHFKIGAACTYTGDTVISNGCIDVLVHGALPEAGTLRLAGENARLAVWTNDVTLAGFGGGGRLSNTSTGDERVGSLTVTDRLVFDGASLAAGLSLDATAVPVHLQPNLMVEIADTNLLATTGRPYTLMTLRPADALAYTPALKDLQPPWTLYRTDNGTKLKLIYQVGTTVILR